MSRSEPGGNALQQKSGAAGVVQVLLGLVGPAVAAALQGIGPARPFGAGFLFTGDGLSGAVEPLDAAVQSGAARAGHEVIGGAGGVVAFVADAVVVRVNLVLVGRVGTVVVGVEVAVFVRVVG